MLEIELEKLKNVQVVKITKELEATLDVQKVVLVN